MSGSLLALSATGAQDAALTGTPSVTFFRSVHRAHTPFSIEEIAQSFNGSVDFGKRITSTLSRSGDLINGLWLEITLPAQAGNVGYVQSVAHALIKEASVEIGGTMIDRHDGVYMKMLADLTTPAEKQAGYKKMVGTYDTVPATRYTMNSTGGTYYLPLRFWFCESTACALPLLALQYHEARISLTLRNLNEIVWTDGIATASGSITGLDLWASYVFLGSQERKRIVQTSSESLVYLVGHTGSESIPGGVSSAKIRLSTNHPTSSLLIAVTRDDQTVEDPATGNDIFNFGSMAAGDAYRIASMKLVLNSHDRTSARTGAYWHLVSNYTYSTNVPDSHIYLMSFGLQPESYTQPSGTINFSRIDSISLDCSFDTVALGGNSSKLYVFARVFNSLRVSSGLAGLSYSN